MRTLIRPRVVESHTYVPAIDALRALAVVAVMIFHLAPNILPGGFVGVDVFFVISGFVVAGSMTRDAKLPFTKFIAAFYARRFRRIVPAVVVCLLGTVLFSMAVIPDAWLSNALSSTGLAAFFGLSNFALVANTDGYFSTRTDFNPFTHTWSLAVEEQFYLLFPLLYYLCIPRGAGRRIAQRSRWALALISLSSLGWCGWATTNLQSWAYYMLPSRFWELGLGAIAYLLGDKRRTELSRRCGPNLLLATGLILIGWTLVFADKEAFPFPWALPATAGTVLLLVSTADGPYRSRLGQTLSSPPIIWIGLISYSLYLWHWPVYTLMRWTTGIDSAFQYILAVGATFILAWISYRYIETPPQRNDIVRRMPPSAVIAAGLTIVLAGWGMALEIYARPWPFKRTVVEKQREDWYPTRTQSARRLAGMGLTCEVTVVNRTPGASVYVPYNCPEELSHSGHRLFAAGDSHAGALDRLLDLTARRAAMEIWKFSKAGCGLAYIVKPIASLTADCVAFLNMTTDTILRLGRPGDVLLLDSLRIPRFVDQWGPVNETRGLPQERTITESVLNAEAEALELVKRFTKVGMKVVFVLPKPIFKAPPFRCADWFNEINSLCKPGFVVSKDLLLERRRKTVDAMSRIVASTPATFIWDPLPALCPGDQCSAFDGSRPIYFDADHLSGHGNELLLPSFLASLSSWLMDPAINAPVQSRPSAKGSEPQSGN